MNFKPKILVIRQLALGDVILTTPIVRQLYADYQGDCLIDVLTMRPEIYDNNPMVNEAMLPAKYLENNRSYDKTINLDLAYERYPNMHILEAYAKYSHGSIEMIKIKKVDIFTCKLDRENLNRILGSTAQSKYMVIHMRNDTWPSRNIKMETWRSIIDIILNTTDLNIVQVGSLQEHAFDHNPRLINMLGKLTISELKETIAGSTFYFGIDSGTLHVASSTETPIICLFTSAHHLFRKPLGRKIESIFIPITPKIECYGCQSRIEPPVTGVICSKGDPYAPPCRDAFDMKKIEQAISLVDSAYAH